MPLTTTQQSSASEQNTAQHGTHSSLLLSNRSLHVVRIAMYPAERLQLPELLEFRCDHTPELRLVSGSELVRWYCWGLPLNWREEAVPCSCFLLAGM